MKQFCFMGPPFGMERMKGIEPSYQAWEARILPLNYTRMNFYLSILPVFRSFVKVFLLAYIFFNVLELQQLFHRYDGILRP